MSPEDEVRVQGLGFRVQHLKSEHSLVEQLVKGWNKTPPTQETHNIEKIQSPLNTFPVGLKLKVQLAEKPKSNSQTGEGGVGGAFGVVLEANFPQGPPLGENNRLVTKGVRV